MKRILIILTLSFFLENVVAQQGDAAYRDNAGLRGDAGALSGFYQTNNPINFPTGATSYWHFLDIRHTNTANNYAMQFAGSFFDQELFFRKTNDNPAQPWSKIWHSGNTPLPFHQWRSYIGNDINASLNDMPANSTVFAYYAGLNGANTNAPVSGPVTHFSGFDNGSYGMQLQSNYLSGELYTRVKNDDISTWTSWRRVLSETSSGNIGIGTLEPIVKLHVIGTAIIGNPSGGNYNENLRLPVANNDYSSIALGTDNNASGTVPGQWALVRNPSVMNNRFSIRHMNDELFSMQTNGNIGIGTVNPTQKLAVNGTILAKKVKVSQAASDWPDYVFDSSYQLPSLDSVSSFIQVNKHLPDMPSAAVVEKDGHDLGEVQKLLLKKMEEMTLYIIKQEEKIKEQGNKIEALERKLSNTSK